MAHALRFLILALIQTRQFYGIVQFLELCLRQSLLLANDFEYSFARLVGFYRHLHGFLGTEHRVSAVTMPKIRFRTFPPNRQAWVHFLRSNARGGPEDPVLAKFTG
jgi:hypothetical protein